MLRINTIYLQPCSNPCIQGFQFSKALKHMLSIRTTTSSTCSCSLDLVEISTCTDNWKDSKEIYSAAWLWAYVNRPRRAGSRTDHVLQIKHVVKLLAEAQALFCYYTAARDTASPDRSLHGGKQPGSQTEEEWVASIQGMLSIMALWEVLQLSTFNLLEKNLFSLQFALSWFGPSSLSFQSSSLVHCAFSCL